MSRSIFTCGLLMAMCLSASPTPVALSSLDLSLAKQGYGQPGKDSSVDGHPLSIAGEKFARGFGTHSVGRLDVDPRGATAFHAKVGIDDDAGTGRGSAEFTVFGDGKLLWASGVMKQGLKAKPVDVPLAGVKKLSLVVTDGGDGFDHDHADWADASFDVAGDPPVAVPVVPTELLIAKPMTASAKPASYDAHPAMTPPLGWNSYDGYGDSVTEAEMLANAAAFEKQLKPHGWQYVVVDYRWYDPGAFNNDPNSRAGVELTADAFGRLVPSPNRFPSAKEGAGFKPLADKIHGMGLKFGIHVMRGIPRQSVKANTPIEGSPFHAADAADESNKCVWNPDMFGVRGETPAGQAWYDSILRQYAGWGVDFVKVDDLSSPYYTAEVAAIRRAIDKTGRPIAFSTSPGPAPLDHADHLVRNANQWRCTGDFWDDTKQLNDAMDVCAKWNGHGGPGHWPDMDMLPLGRLSVGGRSVGPDRRTKLTKSQQVTMMTMWSIFPSPLMLGGDLTAVDEWEISLLSNDDVLAVNQDPLGRSATRCGTARGAEVWSKELADGSTAVAIFNRTELDSDCTATWAELGLYGPFKARDLWQRKDLGVVDGNLVANIPAHAAGMYRLAR